MRRLAAVAATMSVALLGASLPARAIVYTQFTYQRVRIPMRDGVTLSADIWRPVTPAGTLVPAVISMTPYHVLYKALDRTETDLPQEPGQLVRQGFAYARVDVRGTYNSGGCWDYGGLKERQDGYDTVEWFGGVLTDGTPSAAAVWSNGKVAMIGASYDGTTANAAAVEHPPHLATIVPISAISRWYGYAYQQGARATYSGESADIDPPGDTPTDFMFAYGFVPAPDFPLDRATEIAMRWTPCDRATQTLHGYDTQPDYDAFWMERDYLRLASQVNVPVLVAHGFLDFNVKTWEGTAWFQALPGEKMLVAGQWPHALPALPGWNTLLRRWFDRWLYDIANGVETEPAVRVQDQTRTWRAQNDWGNVPRVVVPLSGGDRTFFDDGALTESEMLRGLTPQRYVRVAVPGTAGARIEGRPVLHLRAASDRPGTHFVAILCDVGPDGACTVVSRAFMNARYRASLEQGTDLVPGQAETYDLEFIDKDWSVSATNHLELIIASSSSTWVASDEHRATNTISLDASSLELPLRMP